MQLRRGLPRSGPSLLAAAACALAAVHGTATEAVLNSNTLNSANVYAAAQLYSPTSPSAAISGANINLSWTAAQPNGNGNGNGYAISGVNNGGSSTCPISAASYTTYVDSTTAVTYTDSTSTLRSGTGGTYVCYLIQTGYSPAGGPPWGSLPLWTSTDTLASAAVQLPSSPPTITGAAVCDQDGNPAYPVTANWIHQGGTYIVYANVTGAGITSVSSAMAPTAGGTPVNATLTAASGTCAGTSYGYTSTLQTEASSQAAGSNLIWLNVSATNSGGTVQSNSGHSGNVSVDNTTPGTPAGLGHGTGQTGTGLLVFKWNASTTGGASGMAGYDVEVYLQNSSTRASQYPNGIYVSTANSSCTYTDQAGGSTTQPGPCAVLNLTAGTKYDLKVAAVSNSGVKSGLASQGGVSAP